MSLQFGIIEGHRGYKNLYKKYFFKSIFSGLLFSSLIACSKNNNIDPASREPGKFPIPEVVNNRSIDNWFTQSPDLEKVEGVQADRAYQELLLKNEKEIVVAVIDSGVDIYHEDLQGKIWENSGEIPDDGKDNDKNGYIDDINGWNFIGGYDQDGKPTHVNYETLEVTRELVKMKIKKINLEKKGKKLSDKDQAYLDLLQTEVTDSRKAATKSLATIRERLGILQNNYEVIKDLINVSFDKMTEKTVLSAQATNEIQEKAITEILAIFAKGSAKDVARYKVLEERYQSELDYYYNENYDARKKIVGDKPEDFSDVKYGNNDVIGPDADHGTHVAGIIAARRENDLGIRGIASNVKIMVLRVVPNGDERDKDVALAVKYAVKNGAHIINMSFGKGYSPHKHLVSKEFLYAQSKGVLILHAAGNESKNRDLEDRFPARKVYNSKHQVIGQIDNWLDVGASSATLNRELTATFTNYGQTTVDLFAPGVKVNSTIPGNKYAAFNGTSMACPAAAGVAALVWSQIPNANGKDIKDLMMASTRARGAVNVRLPSDHAQDVPFEKLSITGGVADAFLILKNLKNP